MDFVLHHATPDLFTTHDTDKPAWADRAIDIYLSITNQPQPPTPKGPHEDGNLPIPKTRPHQGAETYSYLHR